MKRVNKRPGVCALLFLILHCYAVLSHAKTKKPVESGLEAAPVPFGEITFSKNSASEIQFTSGAESTVSISGKVRDPLAEFLIDSKKVQLVDKNFEFTLSIPKTDKVFTVDLKTTDGKIYHLLLKSSWAKLPPPPFKVKIKTDKGIVTQSYNFEGTFPRSDWVYLYWMNPESEREVSGILNPVPSTFSGALSPLTLAVDGKVVFESPKSYWTLQVNDVAPEFYNGDQHSFFMKTVDNRLDLTFTTRDDKESLSETFVLPRLEIIGTDGRGIELRAFGETKIIQLDGKTLPVKNGKFRIDAPKDEKWLARLHLLEMLPTEDSPGRIYEFRLNEKVIDKIVAGVDEATPPSRETASMTTPEVLQPVSLATASTALPVSPTTSRSWHSVFSVGLGTSYFAFTQPTLSPISMQALSLRGDYQTPLTSSAAFVAQTDILFLPLKTWGTDSGTRLVQVSGGVRKEFLNDEIFKFALQIGYEYGTLFTPEQLYGFRHVMGPKLSAITGYSVSGTQDLQIALGFSVLNSDQSVIDVQSRSYEASIGVVRKQRGDFSLGYGARYKRMDVPFSAGAVEASILGAFVNVDF